MIGLPYDRDFKYMVRNNMIKNFPITASDVTDTHTTFDLNLTSTRDPDIVMMYYVYLPRDFLKLHMFVTIVADAMFVNGASFLITIACGINVLTVENVPTSMAKYLGKY